MVPYSHLVQVQHPLHHSSTLDRYPFHLKGDSKGAILPNHHPAASGSHTPPIRVQEPNRPVEIVLEEVGWVEEVGLARSSWEKDNKSKTRREKGQGLSGVIEHKREGLRIEGRAAGQSRLDLKPQETSPGETYHLIMPTVGIRTTGRYAIRLGGRVWERVEGSEACARCKRLDIGCYLRTEGEGGEQGAASCMGCHTSKVKCSPFRSASCLDFASEPALDDGNAALLDTFFGSPHLPPVSDTSGNALNTMVSSKSFSGLAGIPPTTPLSTYDHPAGVTPAGIPPSEQSSKSPVSNENHFVPPPLPPLGTLLAEQDDALPSLPDSGFRTPLDHYPNVSIPKGDPRMKKTAANSPNSGAEVSSQTTFPCLRRPGETVRPSTLSGDSRAASSNKRGLDLLLEEPSPQWNGNNWGPLFVTAPLSLAAPKPSQLLCVPELEATTPPHSTKRRRMRMDSAVTLRPGPSTTTSTDFKPAHQHRQGRPPENSSGSSITMSPPPFLSLRTPFNSIATRRNARSPDSELLDHAGTPVLLSAPSTTEAAAPSVIALPKLAAGARLQEPRQPPGVEEGPRGAEI